jgi:hypothetical protein
MTDHSLIVVGGTLCLFALVVVQVYAARRMRAPILERLERDHRSTWNSLGFDESLFGFESFILQGQFRRLKDGELSRRCLEYRSFMNVTTLVLVLLGLALGIYSGR